MNTYNKNGQRQAKLAERKKTKAHVKAFYNILGQMDVVAKQLDPTIEYTEENIDSYVNPIIGRDLDSYEKFIILGKMHYKKRMKQKITIKNIKSFLEGNIQLGLEQLNLQPQHIQEQIAYRRLLCKDDCAISNKCIICGCDFKGKTSVVKSCNPDRFPDLMSKIKWNKFKETNGIK